MPGETGFKDLGVGRLLSGCFRILIVLDKPTDLKTDEQVVPQVIFELEFPCQTKVDISETKTLSVPGNEK